jgi:hypothetical protein
MGVSGQRHVPAALCPGERTHGTHCTGGWVGLRAGLDTEVRGKILCPYRRSNPDWPVVQSVVRHYTYWATPAPVSHQPLLKQEMGYINTRLYWEKKNNLIRVSSTRIAAKCTSCSCRWGGSRSLNCGHQQAYCSPPKCYMSTKSHDKIILTGDNRRTRR